MLNPASALPLKDPTLLRQANCIDGKWVEADSGRTLLVNNPATGERVGEVPAMGAAETRRAIEAADRALHAWRGMLAKERAAILRKLNDLMLANSDDLAVIMTAEQGKPLAESRGEIVYAASFIEWFAEEGKRVYGDTIPQNAERQAHPGHQAARRGVRRDHALELSGRHDHPQGGSRLGGRLHRRDPSGEPDPIFGARLGGPRRARRDAAGRLQRHHRSCVARPAGELTSNPLVRKLTFTGSTEVGAKLLAACAPTVKKTSMELGGNAPFIVFDDADLDAAVQGAIASKYRNTGQTCVCANRILVQDGVYDAFTAKLREAVEKLKVGNGMEEGVDSGAADQRGRREEGGGAYRGRGARGRKDRSPAASGMSWAAISSSRPSSPTCHATLMLFREETFGPLAPLFRFKTEDEAIRLANDTEFGLAAYFYARDVGRIFRVAEALEYGIVGINEGIISTEVAPFGGIKASGLGPRRLQIRDRGVSRDQVPGPRRHRHLRPLPEWPTISTCS